VYVVRLAGCENFVGKWKEFIFNALSWASAEILRIGVTREDLGKAWVDWDSLITGELFVCCRAEGGLGAVLGVSHSLSFLQPNSTPFRHVTAEIPSVENSRAHVVYYCFSYTCAFVYGLWVKVEWTLLARDLKCWEDATFAIGLCTDLLMSRIHWQFYMIINNVLCLSFWDLSLI